MDGFESFSNKEILGTDLSLSDGKVVVPGQAASPQTASVTTKNSQLSASSAAKTVNEGIKNGVWEAKEVKGQVMIRLTDAVKAQLARNTQVSTNQVIPAPPGGTCGITDLLDGENGGTAGLYLNDSDTEEVVELLLGGAAVSAVAGVVLGMIGTLGATIFAWIPMAVAEIIAACLAYAAGMISANNDGCGVLITLSYNAIPTGVEPQ